MASTHVAQPDRLLDGAQVTDSDQVLRVVVTDQLVDIDRQRWQSHAVPWTEIGRPLVRARETQHVSNRRVAGDVFEIGLRDPFGAERIARQQEPGGDLPWLRCDGVLMAADPARAVDVGFD